MKLRKLGELDWVDLSLDQVEEANGCAFCAAGHATDWGGEPGVIFFESEASEVRRVECLHADVPLVMMCTTVTLEEARSELAAQPR